MERANSLFAVMQSMYDFLEQLVDSRNAAVGRGTRYALDSLGVYISRST